MDGAMGQEEDVVEAVLTCEGDFHDPELTSRLERFRHRLKDLLLTEKHKLHVKKVEPWNSVKVTFTIPRDAAIRLRQLAQNGSEVLKQMGVRSVQIQGDSQISLTLAGQNSQSTQLILRTPPSSQCSSSSLPSLVATDPGTTSSDECGPSRIPTKDEMARRNIMDYFKHGSALRSNASFFDTIIGAGSSPVSTAGAGVSVAESLTSLPGHSESSNFFRFNNIATTALPNPTVGGLPITSSFQMKKSTGAFHPAIPRISSLGHSSTPNSTHLDTTSTYTGTPLSTVESSANGLHHSLTTTSSLDYPRSSLTPPSTSYNPLHFHSPPSSFPSNYVNDLPPPPPYPHKFSSLSQLGKPVTASSPLLINLLQTDPMAAAALLASNKCPPAKDKRSGSPFKKKRRLKNATDGLVTPYLFNERTTGNDVGFHSRLIASDMDDVSDTVSYSEHTVSDSATDLFSVNLAQHRPEDLFVSDMQDCFLSGFHADIKSSFSPDYSGNELSHSPNMRSVRFHSGNNSRGDTLPLRYNPDCSSKSAIETERSYYKPSDSNGLKTMCSDLDPFAMESAAGKIINPYTGHLEPRESEDCGQIRITEPSVYQGDKYTAQVFARTAKEINKFSVPTSCSLLDVHVPQTIPSPVPCTAAIFNSGGPLQTFSSKWKHASTQPSSSVSNASFRVTDENSLLSNIYAVNEKPWHELVHISDDGCKYLSSSGTRPSGISSSVSSTHQKSFAGAPALHTGPVAGVQLPKHSISSSQHQLVTPSAFHSISSSQHQHITSQHQHRMSQHQHITSQHQHLATSFASGAGPAIPESVIYSSMALPVSVSLPISRHTHMTQSQQTAIPAAVNYPSFPPTLQSLAASPRPLTSKLVPSCTPSHLSVHQAAERWKTTCSSHLSPSHHPKQAANCHKGGDDIASTLGAPNLLNSLRINHIDSLGSIESPPDIKASPEGDDNSSHNGLFTDNLAEQSGATALLEHCSVKAENHDSGVGSSSERSDDTPSEPGDGEFRSGQIVAENEDICKTSTQKVGKTELKVNSSLNAATVCFTMNSLGYTSQPKLTYMNANNHVISTPELPSSCVFPPHPKSLDKQAELMATSPRIPSMSIEAHSSLNYSERLGDDGLSTDDMGIISSGKVNCPSFQVNTDKMTTVDKHQKKRSFPKHKDKKGPMEVQTPSLKLQTEMLEKMSKFHHLAECAKETSNMATKASSFDKCESPDALSQRLKALEDRPDQYIFDMEDLVNGKTLGHGIGMVDNRGGSNITSIYSKRSSPVNVNMLNHIYAPGLPLPRRLTESVQRLVKPLPASETSVIAPQTRLCKSPASGMSPRAGSSTLNYPRMSSQSAVRSVGANVPKLGPADIHSLMSGGFDLTGLSSIASTHLDHAEQTKVSYKRGANIMQQDILFPESHFSPRQNQLVNNQFETKLYSSKVLSQSFPPCKFIKDLNTSTSHTNHDLLLGSSSALEKNNFSSSLHADQDSFFSNSMMETQHSKSHQDSFFSNSMMETHHSKSHQDSFFSNSMMETHNSKSHRDSFFTNSMMETHHNKSHRDSLFTNSMMETHNSKSRLDSLHSSQIPSAFFNTIQFLQQSTAAECTHSSVTNQDEENVHVFTSHSSLPVSPVMANLQQRQDLPLARTMPPSMSSHTVYCTAAENPSLIGSSIPSSCATVTTHNMHVPYSTTLANVPSMAVSTTGKGRASLTTSSPMPVTPTGLGTIESQSFPTASTFSHSFKSTSSPPKLANVFTSKRPLASSPRSGSHTPLFSRNLFESVSGNCQQVSGNCQQVSGNCQQVSGNCERVSGTGNCERDSQKALKHCLGDAPVDQAHHGKLPLCNSEKVLYSSSLTSKESQIDLLVRNTKHRSLDSAEKGAAATVCPPGTTDISEVGTSVHSSLELPHSTSPLTQAVPFESSQMSQAGDASYFIKDRDKGAMKTNLLVSSTVQERHISEPIQSHSPSSVKSSLSCDVDSAANVSTSAAEETSILAPSSSMTSVLPVTEPNLKALASTDSIMKATQAGLDASFVERQEPYSDIHQRESDISNERALVVTPSGSPRLQDHSPTQASAVVATAAAHTSGTLIQTLIHQRKLSHNEDEAFSTESIPGKHSQPVHSLSLVNTSMMTSVVEASNNLVDGHNISDHTETHKWIDDKNHSQSKVSANETIGSQDKGSENGNHRTDSAQGRGDKACLDNGEQPHSLSSPEDKERTSTGNSYQLAASGTVDSQINRQSLSESIDLPQKENMAPHYISIISGDSSIETCAILMETGPSVAEDSPKDGQCDGTMPVVHKDTTHIITIHKDINCHPEDLCDEHDGHDSHPNSTCSPVDKIISALDADPEKTVLSHKELLELKLDDGLKKSNRIKRQFYAYIPEKSIDQTYFDAPILSGRTRSKSKPNDIAMQDSTLTEDKSALITNTMESLSYHPVGGHQVAAGIIDDVFDGKRPTRSIKSKDNCQDSSTSKRRRLQHR